MEWMGEPSMLRGGCPLEDTAEMRTRPAAGLGPGARKARGSRNSKVMSGLSWGRRGVAKKPREVRRGRAAP